jgi:hypothetical protein
MRRIDYMRMLHQVDALNVEDLYSDFPSASWIREPFRTNRVAFLAGEETTGDADVADDAAPNAARPDAHRSNACGCLLTRCKAIAAPKIVISPLARNTESKPAQPPASPSAGPPKPIATSRQAV